MTRALLPLAALALWIASCGETPATQIVVVIDTDIPVPAEVDTMFIRVEGPSTERRDQAVSLDGLDATPLPLTFGMVPASSALGPVTVTVTGRIGDGDVVTRVVKTRFVAEQSRLLRIRLQRACVAVLCDAASTCDGGVCRDPVVEPDDLPPFTGRVVIDELCNGRDDDADGEVDEDFELTTDAQNCGACGNTCLAGRPCVAGTCGDSPIVAVAAGGSHVCALRESGGVACWGSNVSGELGNGTLLANPRPATVLGIQGARDLSSGTLYSCAVEADHSVACWGSGMGGELGIGVFEDRLVPAPTVGVTDAMQVAVGYFHSCALRAGRTLRCWGHDDFGQLGNGATSDMVTMPVDVADVMDATEVRIGFRHTCALRASGQVVCWGDGASGQLGNGVMGSASRPMPVTGLMDALQVVAAGSFSCARTMRGNVQCWGGNASGQLGVDPMSTPTSATPVTVTGLAAPAQISAPSNGEFACALLPAGTVSCWGTNDLGQLGDGTTTNRFLPAPVMSLGRVRQLSAGSTFACALLESREVWCWGDNSSGQLGDGTATTSNVPVRVNGL